MVNTQYYLSKVIEKLWRQRMESFESCLYLYRRDKELAMLPDDEDGWTLEYGEAIRQNLTKEQFHRKMHTIVSRLPIL